MKRKLIIAGVVLFAVCCASADAVVTTGVYDENVFQANQVDFQAAGSTISSTQLASQIASAYPLDFGGVIDGTLLAGSRSYSFGGSRNKELHFDVVEGQHWGVGTLTSTSSIRAISGNGAFAFSLFNGRLFHSFTIDVLNADPAEHVVAFGLTVLSVNNRDYGNVLLTGVMGSGQRVNAVRQISEPAAQGDTFFGFAAPQNDYISGFEISYDGPVVADTRLWFDDIGFITRPVPEPSAFVMLLSLVGVFGLRLRR